VKSGQAAYRDAMAPAVIPAEKASAISRGGVHFKIGDQVVHPHHGLGVITNLANRQFEPGKSRAYYEISVGNGTLWVPVDEPGLGLRRLSARRDLAHCGRILEGAPSSVDLASHELRERLAKHLKDGTILAQCEVVRDLSSLGWRKPLQGSLAEFRRMALSVLCQEWAAVAGISVEAATDEINAHLERGKQAHNG
jgi:RNA polymerase-interacting CarD/CdnL/TRCF family regulator